MPKSRKSARLFGNLYRGKCAQGRGRRRPGVIAGDADRRGFCQQERFDLQPAPAAEICTSPLCAATGARLARARAQVLYHSDGNWKRLIPDLVGCEVDGFYCLEPALGMDIVELAAIGPGYLGRRPGRD